MTRDTDFRLPRTSTGFRDRRVEGFADGLDRQLSVTACHHAGRVLKASVSDIITAGVTPNFDAIVITERDRPTAVLRHTTVPFVALIDGPPPTLGEPQELTFVDVKDLRGALRQAGVPRVLTPAELSIPLSEADLSELDRSEHEQIAYWQPETVGDVLFNYWD